MYCKVCSAPNLSISVRLNLFRISYSCGLCSKFKTIIDSGIVESETINIGNYYLVFLPASKEASIVEINNSTHNIIKNFELEELTPEIISQWMAKLKTYVIFQ